jgi:hypothetical protein
MAEEVISHELLLLETLGFDVTIKHPHVFVVKCVQMLRGASLCVPSALSTYVPPTAYVLTYMTGVQFSVHTVSTIIRRCFTSVKQPPAYSSH